MAQFAINIGQVSPLPDNEAAVARKLSGYADEIRKIADELSIKSSAASGIKLSLRSVAGKIDGHSASMSRMNSALSSIVDKYNNAERKIWNNNLSGGLEAIGQINKYSSITDTETMDDLRSSWADILYKLNVAASGFAGSVIDIGKNLADQKWAKGISGILKLTGSVIKNTNGTKVSWGDLFGLIKPGEAKSVGAAAFGKYFDFSSIKKGVSSSLNLFAAGISSWCANYKEFEGDLSNGRFWQETAVETGINVLEGMAVTAFVATTIGTGGIPLIAGVISTGVTVAADWGLNVLTNWATNGAWTDWKEAFSDGICNFSEWLDESAGKAGQWVGEKARVAVDWVQDKAEAAVNWASDAADTVTTGISNSIDAVKNGLGSICSWGKTLVFG